MKEPTIETLEERLRQAQLTSDVLALDELIADDLIFTGPDGSLVNKHGDLDAHESGALTFTKVEFSDRKVQHHDNFAIAVTKADLAGVFNKQAFSGAFRYTRVWAKREEKWQVVAGHVSQITLNV